MGRRGLEPRANGLKDLGKFGKNQSHFQHLQRNCRGFDREATTLNVFDDEHDAGGVPDAWVDLVADLASIGRVDRIVAALLPEGLA